MKHKIIYSILVGVIIVLTILNFMPRKSEALEDDIEKVIKHEDTLSMMIEQTAGVSDYKMEQRTSWPTDGYIFNAKLSKCENGGELAWDSTNNVVTMTGNMSDRCYAYFDILPGDIDISFVGSTSTTLKINVISEDGLLSTDYNTYYYSTDGGTTYVSSNENTYSIAYSENEITSFSVYANNTKYGDSNVISKNVFNGGTVRLVKNLDYSDSICGYYEASEPKFLVRSLSNSDNVNNSAYVKKMGSIVVGFSYYFNSPSSPGTDNMSEYLFYNSILELNGHGINGSGSNDYYIRMVGTSAIKSIGFGKWNNLNIISDGGTLTISSGTISKVSNLYFSLTDTTLNIEGLYFSDVSTLVFNLNGTVSINNDVGMSIYGDTVLIKVTGNSNVLSGTISSFADLSSDGVTFLKALINNTYFSVTTLSFDFNGFTFTLDEAKTYINSLS